jgi:hypothetical protein
MSSARSSAGLVVPAVVLQRDRRQVRELIRRDEVAPAQLGRVDPQLAGAQVDHPL